jgi:hypothetical protein
MDFSTIRRKLNNNEYSGISSFVDDIELMRTNSVKFNGESSIFTFICEDFVKEVQKQLSTKPNNFEEEWFLSLQKVVTDLNEHVQQAPPEISHLSQDPMLTEEPSALP